MLCLALARALCSSHLAEGPRRSGRKRRQAKPKSWVGEYSQAATLRTREERKVAVAAAPATKKARRSTEYSASVDAFAATVAVVEAGEVALSAARVDADWRPGGPKMLELARQPRGMGD
jgi:hypothetical protein